MCYDYYINPPSSLVSGQDTNRRAVASKGPPDKFNMEVAMADREEKRLERDKKAKQEYAEWAELSKAHWSHWRAWGSWFSWGSPVGLGIFLVLLAVTFAIFKFAIVL